MLPSNNHSINLIFNESNHTFSFSREREREREREYDKFGNWEFESLSEDIKNFPWNQDFWMTHWLYILQLECLRKLLLYVVTKNLQKLLCVIESFMLKWIKLNWPLTIFLIFFQQLCTSKQLLNLATIQNIQRANHFSVVAI